jgi:hypothetical protein
MTSWLNFSREMIGMVYLLVSRHYIFKWYIDILQGGAINGFDNDAFPKEITTLHWFNRIVNLVHEHAPKAKFIFVSGPTDLADSFERVLGSLENPPETV